MSKATNYLENAIFNHVFRNVAMASPAAVYLGLFTSDPTDAVSGAEVGGGVGYARKLITFGAPADGVGINNATIDFDIATGAGWGLITHWCTFDALVAGNGLVYGSFSSPQTILAGLIARVANGQITVTVA